VNRRPYIRLPANDDQLRHYFSKFLFIDTDCDVILGESFCNGDARKLVDVIGTEAVGPLQYRARE
jgi:hypothetical protein